MDSVHSFWVFWSCYVFDWISIPFAKFVENVLIFDFRGMEGMMHNDASDLNHDAGEVIRFLKKVLSF